MYYKILKKSLKHHGMRYHEGLNENCEETLLDGECENGLFFTDEKHIFSFVDYGTKIADVELPEGEPFCEVDGEKYKAHRIILKNIRNFWTAANIKKLIKAGADIHIDDDFALRWASANGCHDIVKLLIENGANVKGYNNFALIKACREGYYDITKLLLENGADVHASDDYALRLASDWGYSGIVELLLENGANIHASDNYALRCAEKHGYIEIVELLKSYI